MKNKFLSRLSLGDIFNNRRFNVIFSAVVAFVFWLVIMINQNPVREQTFSDIAATVSIDNTVVSEMGLGIVSDVASQKFTVVVSGPNYMVSSLKPEDFILSASVTDVNAAGTYSLDILGARNSSKSGYTFVSITPATIDVTFDYIDTKQFTVTPKLTGVGAVDGLIAETPVVTNSDNSTITIKGPRSVMDTISTVGAYAEVNKTLSSTQTYDAGIVLYNADGDIIYTYATDGKIYDGKRNQVDSTHLTLSFTSVKVTAPISKKATVNVKAAFSKLPDGVSADNIAYSIDHSTVTIIGTPDVVDSLSSITLSAIDFTGVSSTSNSFEVSAVLPDGIKLLDNIDYFTVTIDTSGYAEKTFVVSNIKYSGLGSSLTAKTGDVIKNVKVCGPADVIAGLKSADLYAFLDLTDKPAGEHTINAVIKSDAYNMIWQIGTYSTTVTIN